MAAVKMETEHSHVCESFFSTIDSGYIFGSFCLAGRKSRRYNAGNQRDYVPSISSGYRARGHPTLVINEIMYHPYHPDTEPEDIRKEYIELFNRGSEPVSLTGWRISNGVDFVFPDVTLGAGEYLVVAADADTFKANYPSISNVVGGWAGRLSNRGEAIEILDDAGVWIDRVSYSDEGDWAVRELGPEDYTHRGWVWSNQHDGGGNSLELINAGMPNEYGRNWAASFAGID
jgi:hypothetical protein